MKTALIALVLAGCATPPPARFISDEQDAEIRDKCQETGCAIIPVPLMQRLLQMLGDRTT